MYSNKLNFFLGLEKCMLSVIAKFHSFCSNLPFLLLIILYISKYSDKKKSGRHILICNVLLLKLMFVLSMYAVYQFSCILSSKLKISCLIIQIMYILLLLYGKID